MSQVTNTFDSPKFILHDEFIEAHRNAGLFYVIRVGTKQRE
ncbi:MAG TPA: hypothetical protein VI146_03395 [Nitrososphaeraceae archaeon]